MAEDVNAVKGEVPQKEDERLFKEMSLKDQSGEQASSFYDLSERLLQAQLKGQITEYAAGVYYAKANGAISSEKANDLLIIEDSKNAANLRVMNETLDILDKRLDEIRSKPLSVERNVEYERAYERRAEAIKEASNQNLISKIYADALKESAYSPDEAIRGADYQRISTKYSKENLNNLKGKETLKRNEAVKSIRETSGKVDNENSLKRKPTESLNNKPVNLTDNKPSNFSEKLAGELNKAKDVVSDKLNGAVDSIKAKIGEFKEESVNKLSEAKDTLKAKVDETLIELRTKMTGSDKPQEAPKVDSEALKAEPIPFKPNSPEAVNEGPKAESKPAELNPAQKALMKEMQYESDKAAFDDKYGKNPFDAMAKKYGEDGHMPEAVKGQIRQAQKENQPAENYKPQALTGQPDASKPKQDLGDVKPKSDADRSPRAPSAGNSPKPATGGDNSPKPAQGDRPPKNIPSM